MIHKQESPYVKDTVAHTDTTKLLSDQLTVVKEMFTRFCPTSKFWVLLFGHFFPKTA